MKRRYRTSNGQKYARCTPAVFSIQYKMIEYTTKGGSRQLENSHKVWMMIMIAASLMWAGVAEKREQSKMAFKNHQNDSKQLV